MPREIGRAQRAPTGRGTDALGGLLGPLVGGPPAFLVDRNGALRASNEAYAWLAASFHPPLATAVGAPLPVPRSVLDRIVAGGPSQNFEWTYEQDGRPRWLRFELWIPASGTEAVILGLVREQSESASVLRQLHEAEARFEDIARLTSGWVWEVDSEFRFTFVSARIEAMIGVPARFMVGQTLIACGRFEGFPESNYAGHPSPDAMAPFSDVAYEMKSPEGKPILFRLSGVPVFEDGSGRFVGFRGIAHDASAHAAAEARAFIAHTGLVHAIESIPQGFALYGNDDKLLLCNSAYEELLTGRDEQTLVLGKRYAEILDEARAATRFPGGANEIAQVIEACAEHHRNAVEAYEFSLSDGRWILKSVDRTGDGGIVEVWNDITEIRRREVVIRKAEADARRALDLAEAGNRAKSEFLATMSHELRTPLNAIIGFSEIIRDELYGPAGHTSYKDYAADIHSSGRHLLNIISGILEFAKIEAGKLQLTERVVDPRPVLEACMRVVETRAQRAEIKLEMNLPEALPQLKADETRLKQIVLNLLSNAVKFTPPGGTVRLSIKSNQTEGCHIVVEDTGIGIAPQDIRLALSAFGQIESDLSRRYEGTGLGLTLAKSFVEMHGGTLLIESEPKVGTKVTVVLPAERVILR